jgi:hypothetical protein
MNLTRSRRVVTLGIIGLLLDVPANAQVESILYTSDIAIRIGDLLAYGSQVIEQNGAPDAASLFAYSRGGRLNAYHREPTGKESVSFDVAELLFFGPGPVEPRDVVREVEPGVFEFELRGADLGVPSGAVIDAIAVVDGDFLLSFDVSIALSGISGSIDDEDLVRVAAADGTPSLFFDGSASGVPDSLDLDAADHLSIGAGVLALSFDGSGRIAGIAFDDEDVLAYDIESGEWRLFYDGSEDHATWPPADLIAFSVNEACRGDCDDDGVVGLGNLVVAVNVALGRTSPEDCSSIDGNLDGRVSIDELIDAVHASMQGCG